MYDAIFTGKQTNKKKIIKDTIILVDKDNVIQTYRYVFLFLAKTLIAVRRNVINDAYKNMSLSS